MQLTSHKTLAVFERHNIVSSGDLRDAARRLDIYASSAGLLIASHKPGLNVLRIQGDICLVRARLTAWRAYPPSSEVPLGTSIAASKP